MAALPISLDALRFAIGEGATFDYRFFYGHQPAPDGSLSDGCFSQWWHAPFELDGQTYATAEHWMMASKARLFEDEEALAKILVADSPATAKKLGRTVRSFDDDAWRKARFDIVTQGNVAKFSSEPELRAHLLATGEAILVEASPRDRVWGIGLSSRSPDARNPSRWRGSNLLGFALVRARGILRGEAWALHLDTSLPALPGSPFHT